MAELNGMNQQMAQDVATKLREQVTAIRARKSELRALLETWSYLKAVYTEAEIDAGFAGENGGMTYAKIEAGFGALVAMGTVLDDSPTYQAALIALSFAAVK